MVSDLIEETRRRLDGAKPQSVDDIRRLGGPVVAFSDEMRDKERALKRFLFARMYRHERVMGAAGEAKQVVRDLFDAYLAEPELLPAEWRSRRAGRKFAGNRAPGGGLYRRDDRPLCLRRSSPP